MSGHVKYIIRTEHIVIIIVVNIFRPFSTIVMCRHDRTLRLTYAGNGHEVSACRDHRGGGMGEGQESAVVGCSETERGAVTDVANRDAG